MHTGINAAYLGLFLSGIASAATAPYLSTVGLDIMGLSGTQYSSIVFASGILAVAMSLSAGWLSDRIARRKLLISLLAGIAGLGIGAFVLFGSVALFVLCCLIFLPLTSILTQQFFAYLRAESRHLDKLTIENRNARGRTVFASAWVATPLIFLVASGPDPANLAFAASAIACLAGALLFSPIFGGKAQDAGSPITPAGKTGWRSIVTTCLMLTIPLLACGALRAAPRLQQILLGPIVTQEFGGAFAEIGFISGLTALLELPLILMWGYALRFTER